MSDREPGSIEERAERFGAHHRRLREALSEVIVGQEAVLEELLWAVFAGGHVLLEGVPGLGKTLMVRTLGALVGGSFARLQFTPDLMPTDITGTEVLQRDGDGRARFELRRGPVFAHVVLADEINRATPRTQAGLLEAMEEGTVTIGTETLALPRPFFVVATQNPLDLEGTYPLPEAQLDRFLLMSRILPPGEDEMVEIFGRHGGPVVDDPPAVLDPEAMLAAVELAAQLPVAEGVQRYAARLVLATRPGIEGAPVPLRQGAGPRALLALLRCGRVRALADGRSHVGFADVRAVAPAALRHRIRLRYEAEAEGMDIERAIERLLERVTPDA